MTPSLISTTSNFITCGKPVILLEPHFVLHMENEDGIGIHPIFVQELNEVIHVNLLFWC